MPLVVTEPGHVKGLLGHGAGEAVRVVIAVGGGVAGHSTAHGFWSFVLAGLHAMQESSILRSLPQE